ncbi:MAG: AIPR family protein [Lautropia mirabilis]|jgi:hypothetical protein|nr:AIPR family protein [Lautropia mirabilis]
MDSTIDEFFHDFRQDLLLGSEVNGRFQLEEFMEVIASELVETGFIEGFDYCHYRAQRGIRVDGSWFNDEGVLNLFIADFEQRAELASLTRRDIDSAFKRVSSFFEASADRNLAEDIEVTSPEYDLARQIADRRGSISSLNLILFSERTLSGAVQDLPDGEVAGVPASYHVWDISRLHRQRTSRSHKEPLDIDFKKMFGDGVACLPACLSNEVYKSYLMVMPADALATLYGKFGARLLEQNVRTFLQARGNVNKGIRATIMNEPGMFFAYNNGITATAQSIDTEESDFGLKVTRIVDLQIVNGGQTTASLFHTRKRDGADLSHIFVQMKLSVIDSQENEMIVPKISEYANTQNRVNAADFFSNHPFHGRMEEFSRRIWAPAQKGSLRETHWFYERVRGQYADAQSNLTSAEKRRFLAEYPKQQMFTKTELAKFENVWDDHPMWVNRGSQKNFVRYAERIGKEWEKSSDAFNEFYFKRVVARGLIFRATERIVSNQSWYNGGYRANIVAYTLALLAEIAKRRSGSVDFMEVWRTQTVGPVLNEVIALVSGVVNDDITRPADGVSNISEWCKKESCWTRMKNRIEAVEAALPAAFYDHLVSLVDLDETMRSAKRAQKVDNGIEAQKKVLAISASEWARISTSMLERNLLTPKEVGVLKVAMQIPLKLPTEKQSMVLMEVLHKGHVEGIL